MRLLLINPNISDSVSELIRSEALRSAAPQTQITVATAAFGVAYIETRFEAMIANGALAQEPSGCAAGNIEQPQAA
jgi:Asp/Glu/hydantoin racemase